MASTVNVDFSNSNESGLFPTRWGGNCGNCGTEFDAGTSAHYDDGVLVPDDCTCVYSPDGVVNTHADFSITSGRGRSTDIQVMPPGKTKADRCDRCFMIHSPGQDGCE